MLLLTSLVTTWIEHCQSRIPATCPRSYADDLSISAKSHTKKEIIDQTRQMHQITANFINDAGMTINPNKCFTYGHKCIAGCIQSIPHHKNQFRLVGGSVKINRKHCWTDLEQSRADNWKLSVSNERFLPISWQQKVSIIQSIMAQLTFGQGTHQLHLTPPKITSLRAVVIRTLLNADFYDASPAIIFTILAKPSIEPEFAMQTAALQLIFRMITAQSHKQQLLEIITDSNVQTAVDGPISRIQQLYQHEVFRQVLHDFLNGRLDMHKWQHDLRDTFRQNW